MTKGLNLYQSYVPLTGDVLLRAFWHDVSADATEPEDVWRLHIDMLCDTVAMYCNEVMMHWDGKDERDALFPYGCWVIDVPTLLKWHSYMFVTHAVRQFNNLTTSAQGRWFDNKYCGAWSKWEDEIASLPATWVLVSRLFNPYKVFSCSNTLDDSELRPGIFSVLYPQMLHVWHAYFRNHNHYDLAPKEEFVQKLCYVLTRLHMEAIKWR